MRLDRLSVSRTERCVVASLLTGLAAALAFSSFVHSPVPDEPGHLAAGLACWQLDRYELYRVNPPLVRMVAALPVLAMKPNTVWKDFDPWPGRRAEFQVGRQLVAANPDRWPEFFMVARWALIPFVLIGGFVAWLWARQLAGTWAGLGALSLWCTSPEVLAHGSLLTPDAAAASFGLLAGYCYWKWRSAGGYPLALAAGMATGLALLTKMTWLVLLPTWPILWLVTRGRRSEEQTPRGTAIELVLLLVASIFVTNTLYCFDGTMTRLEEFRFISGVLSGVPDVHEVQLGGNRFRDTWLGRMPLPLPREYVLGLDCQQLDFDAKAWSFLWGEWRFGGWWYYYLIAMLIKLPAAWWVLFAAALFGALRVHGRVGWRDHVTLLAPAFAVVAVVSAQTGFNHHFRYVMPAMPFLFVWISVNVVQMLEAAPRSVFRYAALAATLLYAASAFESLRVFPHSQSFFNIFVGGPNNGRYYLTDSSRDWGQDLYFLRRWHAEHPEARPFYAMYYSPEDEIIEREPNAPRDSVTWPGLRPGWHAVPITSIDTREGAQPFWRQLTPVGQIGYSILIFHITESEVERLASHEFDATERSGP